MILSLISIHFTGINIKAALLFSCSVDALDVMLNVIPFLKLKFNVSLQVYCQFSDMMISQDVHIKLLVYVSAITGQS